MDFEDGDPRPGYVDKIEFEFGPNTLAGEVREEGILSYEVWFVDTCGRRVGDAPLATLPRKSMPFLPRACCTAGAYKVSLQDVQLPSSNESSGSTASGNSPELLIMVLPLTDTAGLLSVGAIAGVVHDLTETPGLVAPRVSTAPRRYIAGVISLLHVFTTVAFLTR